MSKLFRWTMAHRRFIEQNINMTDAELAKAIGVNTYRVQAFRMRQGLIKEHGGKFKPGIVPHNKGKRAEWAKGERCAVGQFKPGQSPHNTRKVGDVYKRKEGRCWMWMIKTEAGLKYLHRHIWEHANGAIPVGHNIQFVDGNYDNVTLENLRCVSRAAAAVEAMRKSDTVARAAKIWQTRRLRMAQDASKPFSKAA